MKKVHIECNPDELLVKKLGVKSKQIYHRNGKGTALKNLAKNSGNIAMVDEDDGCNKSSYEKNLILIEEKYGVKVYTDNKENKVLVLKVKLEDWVIAAGKLSEIKMESYNLPQKPNELHSVILNRLKNYERFLDVLLEKKNPALLYLKDQLN
ncbi:MAG: hypothetical protein JXR34_03090 [Bacteroidales bacterium]|nr:hypothetical protein [Bacteroidales bacterium]